MKQIDNLALLVLLVSMLLFVQAVFAHPGPKDSRGGHICRADCRRWGLDYGQYHYHGNYWEFDGETYYSSDDYLKAQESESQSDETGVAGVQIFQKDGRRYWLATLGLAVASVLFAGAVYWLYREVKYKE